MTAIDKREHDYSVFFIMGDFLDSWRNPLRLPEEAHSSAEKYLVAIVE
jgi:hypothetical protein